MNPQGRQSVATPAMSEAPGTPEPHVSPRASTALWSQLTAAGLTTGPMPGVTDSTTPWYVLGLYVYVVCSVGRNT